MHTHMHAHMHAHMHTHMHTHMHAHMHAHTHKRLIDENAVKTFNTVIILCPITLGAGGVCWAWILRYGPSGLRRLTVQLVKCLPNKFKDLSSKAGHGALVQLQCRRGGD